MSNKKLLEIPANWRPVQGGIGAFLGAWNPKICVSSDPSKSISQRSQVKAYDLIAIFFIFCLALALRLFRIEAPLVAFGEEITLGSYLTQYRKEEFFVDTEYPLVSLFYNFMVHVLHINDKFTVDADNLDMNEFKRDFYCIPLRIVASTTGSLVVVMTYLTLKFCDASLAMTILGSFTVAVDNSLITSSQYMSRHPIHIFLISCLLANLKFVQLQKYLSSPWWISNIFLAILSGFIISTHHSGELTWYFVYGILGYQLWWSLADRRFTLLRAAKVVLGQFTILTAIPFVVVFGLCMLHLSKLHTTSGNTFISSQFESALLNPPSDPVAVPVTFGSLIALRHLKTSGYLHSHDFLYESGSHQQQVTTYGFRDFNNIWLLERVVPVNGTFCDELPSLIQERNLYDGDNLSPMSANLAKPDDNEDANDAFSDISLDENENLISIFQNAIDNTAADLSGHDPQVIVHGDLVRLLHVRTHRRLHSHDEIPPLSDPEWAREVSAYGADGFPGDENDIWQVEIVGADPLVLPNIPDKINISEPVLDAEVYEYQGNNTLTSIIWNENRALLPKWQAIDTKVRLRHSMQGCYLFSTRKTLPDYAFQQQEVACAHQGKYENTLWFVESNFNILFENNTNIDYISYRVPTIGEQVSDYLKAVRLVRESTEDVRNDENLFAKFKVQWWKFFDLYYGLTIYENSETNISIRPNFVIWVSTLATMLFYGAFKFYYCITAIKCKNTNVTQSYIWFDHEVGHFFFGWLLHFLILPNYILVNDYTVCFYFSLLIFSLCIDFLLKVTNLNRYISMAIGLGYGLAVIKSFAYQVENTYGNMDDELALEGIIMKIFHETF